MHVFYDVTGGLIAFNRNASLFMNLRFFEGWRAYSITLLMHWLMFRADDAEVAAGDMSKAFVSL